MHVPIVCGRPIVPHYNHFLGTLKVSHCPHMAVPAVLLSPLPVRPADHPRPDAASLQCEPAAGGARGLTQGHGGGGSGGRDVRGRRIGVPRGLGLIGGPLFHVVTCQARPPIEGHLGEGWVLVVHVHVALATQVASFCNCKSATSTYLYTVYDFFFIWTQVEKSINILSFAHCHFDFKKPTGVCVFIHDFTFDVCARRLSGVSKPLQ